MVALVGLTESCEELAVLHEYLVDTSVNLRPAFQALK